MRSSPSRNRAIGKCSVRRALPSLIYPVRLTDCPFCLVQPVRIWMETKHALAIADALPSADGHTLVVPRRHVSTICELTTPEQQALWNLVGEVRERLLTGLKPDGFSIGFSDSMHDGISADHAAVHVVPRRRGESPELPEGVEWVTDDHALARKK